MLCWMHEAIRTQFAMRVCVGTTRTTERASESECVWRNNFESNESLQTTISCFSLSLTLFRFCIGEAVYSATAQAPTILLWKTVCAKGTKCKVVHARWSRLTRKWSSNWITEFNENKSHVTHQHHSRLSALSSMHAVINATFALSSEQRAEKKIVKNCECQIGYCLRHRVHYCWHKSGNRCLLTVTTMHAKHS